jgi:soluble lytic murein transglycosylase
MMLKINYPLKYREEVFKYADNYQVDTYLIFAIIKAESGFKPNAVSKKNARGLMQITETTGKWIADKIGIKNYSFDSLFNPDTNIRMGCWYVKWLLDYFNNNADLAIAAYNGGTGNVKEWLKDRNLSDSGDSLNKIPFKETNDFLKRVKNYVSVYKKLYE